MGFRDAKIATVAALKSRDYVHESRPTQAEKNLLAIGDVSPEDVIRLVRRCRGGQYQESPHDADGTVAVHVFKPEVEGERWYVKVYFIGGFGTTATFISVHR